MRKCKCEKEDSTLTIQIDVDVKSWMDDKRFISNLQISEFYIDARIAIVNSSVFCAYEPSRL